MNNFTLSFGYKNKAMLTLLFLLLGLMYTSKSIGQSAGFNTTYIVLSINGGSNTYYDLQATTGILILMVLILGLFVKVVQQELFLKVLNIMYTNVVDVT